MDFVVFRDRKDWKTWKRWNYCLDCTPLARAWRCDICGATTGDLRQLMHPRSKRLLGFCETCETADDFCWESAIYEALGYAQSVDRSRAPNSSCSWIRGRWT